RLDTLVDGQRALLEGQAQILETQKTIIETQKIIYESIISLSNDLRTSHIEIMGKLDEIKDEVLFNRNLLREHMAQDVESCFDFFEKRKEFQPFSQITGQFLNFSALK